MMNRVITILGILVWFGIGCVVSFFANKRRGRGVADYFIAGGKIGGFVAAMTYSATTYSSFMLVGLVGMVYGVGVSAFGFEITYLMSTVLLLLYFAPKYWEFGRRYNCITPSELLRKRYKSPLLGKIVVIFSLIMLVPYISVQFMGVGYLLKGFAGVPYVLGTFLVLVVVLTYTIWAGMRSVAWTDALQSLIMLVSSTLLVFFVVYIKLNGFGHFFYILESKHPNLLLASGMSYSKFIGLSIPWMFFAITNPQVSQRMFIARDRMGIKRMIVLFAIFGFLYTLIVTNLGLAAKCLFPTISKGDTVTSVLLSHAPMLLSLFVLIGVLAASVSTVNSITLTLSSMLTVDVFRESKMEEIENKNEEEKNLIFAKLTVILLAIVAYLFSLRRIGVIVELSVMSSAGLLAVAPSYIGVFWKKSAKEGAIISIIVGGLVTIVMYGTNTFLLGIWPGIWTGVLSTLSFVLISELTWKKRNKLSESTKVD